MKGLFTYITFFQSPVTAQETPCKRDFVPNKFFPEDSVRQVDIIVPISYINLVMLLP